MSETKTHQFRPRLYHDASRNGSSVPVAAAPVAPAPGAARAPARTREQQGWEAYRKWLSTVGGKPPSERVPADSSIYSWKGYLSWADRVKQAWKPEGD